MYLVMADKIKINLSNLLDTNPVKIPVSECSIGGAQAAQSGRAVKEDDPLVISIRDMGGLIHPIIVKKIEGGYDIVTGQRRWNAHQLLNMSQIKAFVIEKDLTDAERKDASARQRHLQEADVAILCLPDEAARQSVALAEGKTRILDASTAHRVDADWAYGLPEMDPAQREKIRHAQFVSNPGCYPQGFILMIRPLIEQGLLDPGLPLRCNAVSGYSGGGRQMIESRQSFGVFMV